VTYTGERTHYGIVAVDPRVIPLHSRIRYAGQDFYAEDTGAYVRGRHVDFYFSDCAEAAHEFKRIKVRIYRG
jgi:3D (Asp-Asp-Asp) domain-containing protein